MQRKLTALIVAFGMTFAAIPLWAQAEASLDFAVEESAQAESGTAEADGALLASFEGEGTKENPYILSKPLDFTMLAVYVNMGNSSYNSAYYRLSNSIDFDGVSGYIPIGKVTTEIVADTDSDGNVKTDSSGNTIYKEVETAEYPFMGHFDGNGYTIKNLTITSDARLIGIFGLGYNASVENLRIENITINAERDRTMNIGGLFGRYDGNWDSENYITGCHVDGSINVNGGYNVEVGGMIGKLEVVLGLAQINNCRADVDIHSVAKTVSYVGGLIANVETGVDLSKCVVTGSAYGEATGDASSYVGGVAARLRYNDWINVASLADSQSSASLMTQKGYTSASNLVSSIKIEAQAKYSKYIGNTVAQYYTDEATVEKCYIDAEYAVEASGNAYKDDIKMSASELFDKAFLADTVGLDFENTWIMVLGRPDLISKDPYIAYESDGDTYSVQPVGCGACTVYAAAYDADGRLKRAEIETYTEGTPVPVSFDGVEYDTVKLFALDEGLTPLCAARTVSK